MDAEWREVLQRNRNSERPLVFAHIILTKMLGIRRARDIRAHITRRIDLWDRGIHAGLARDVRRRGIPGRAGMPVTERRRMRP